MLKNEDQHRYKVARYICATTSERDYIFLWGAEGLIYFLSDRESPTRFFYQFPLLTPIYQESGIIKEFLNDIVSKKPELIIDTKTNFFPPLDLAEMEKWLKKWTVKKESQYYPPPEDIMGFYRFVYNNYKIEKIICDWTIYRYIN